MDMEEGGFLSDEVFLHMKDARKKNDEWFKLAYMLNRIAQKQLYLFDIQRGNRAAIFKALYFLRGLSSFQAAILLIERGMAQDARTITRSAVETLFYLGAVSKDPSFIDLISMDGKIRLKKFAKSTLRLIEESNLSIDEVSLEKITTHISDLDELGTDGKELKIEYVAKKAGAIDLYNSFYRGLSTDSAHPSTTALERHTTVENGKLIGLKWEPTEKEVESTLLQACVTQIHACTYVNDMIDVSSVSADQDLCVELYNRLRGQSELGKAAANQT